VRQHATGGIGLPTPAAGDQDNDADDELWGPATSKGPGSEMIQYTLSPLAGAKRTESEVIQYTLSPLAEARVRADAATPTAFFSDNDNEGKPITPAQRGQFETDEGEEVILSPLFRAAVKLPVGEQARPSQDHTLRSTSPSEANPRRSVLALAIVDEPATTPIAPHAVAQRRRSSTRTVAIIRATPASSLPWCRTLRGPMRGAVVVPDHLRVRGSEEVMVLLMRVALSPAAGPSETSTSMHGMLGLIGLVMIVYVRGTADLGARL
jgi:hypothetical protein